MAIKKLFLLVFAGLLIFSATPVQAIDFYSENDIYHYDAEASSLLCSRGLTPIEGADAIPSGWHLEGELKALVDSSLPQNLPTYEQVSKETGVPAIFLALLHFRETGLSLEWPSNGQGLYQFAAREGQYPRDGTATQAQFLAGTREIVNDLILPDKVPSVVGKLKDLGYEIEVDTSNPASVTKAFEDEAFTKGLMFAYNGWAEVYAEQAEGLGYENAPWEGSPYVMNLWDADRYGSQASDPNKWGQVKRDHGPIEYPATDQVGAFTLFIALGGQTTSTVCDAAGGEGIQALVEIAKAEYAKSPVEWDTNVLKYTTDRREPWCADFVSWVYKEAGMPFTGGWAEDWQIPAVANMQAWFISGQNGSEYFEAGTKIPAPGDVAFYIGDQTPDEGSTSHVNLVVEVSEDGTMMTTIGGNESDSVRQQQRPVILYEGSLVGFGRLR